MGCVIDREGRCEVVIGGTLVGAFGPEDMTARNLLLAGIGSDPHVHLGRLSAAFDVAPETCRLVRRALESGGVHAIMARPARGPTKLTPRVRERILKAFDEGLSVSEAYERVRRKVGRSTVGNVRKQWEMARREGAGAPSLAADEAEVSTDGGQGGDPAESPAPLEGDVGRRDEPEGEKGVAGFPDSPGPAPHAPAVDAAHVGAAETPALDSPSGAAAESRCSGGADTLKNEGAADDGRSVSEADDETTSDPQAEGTLEREPASNSSAVEGSNLAPDRAARGALAERLDPARELSPEPTPTAAEASHEDHRLSRASWGSEEEDRGAKSRIGQTRLESGRGVQHLGAWLMISVVAAMGLYRHAAAEWSGRFDRVRVALDALVIALAIGQRLVEGVRRLATNTARILLRASHAPSASWVRRILGALAGNGRGPQVQLSMALEHMRASQAVRPADEPSVFYIDNHMRPYTGKAVVRKGWRMQDKRARPGVSDYYVHDEDGRALLRIDDPFHNSLTVWLSPIAELLREALGKDHPILLAFDRGGAFPEQMVELRDTGFQFATYERKPYAPLPASAFERTLTYNGEVVSFGEPRLKNLGKGRGRVRRVAFRASDDEVQVNILAISTLSAERLYTIMRGRWAGQENVFKHGVQRWGINNLDGRTTEPYAPETIIRDPARRRLDEAIRIERAREGHARRQVARLVNPADPARQRWEAELCDALDLQREFEALRPALPTHAPLAETELADVLVKHAGEYKALIDTVRIACANAESELACILAPELRRPAEAKLVLLNLMKAPGFVQVGPRAITVTLEPAGTKNELQALAVLLEECNTWDLVLPGDDRGRPLQFKLQI